jgi:isoquinoline 1-oxidoreductase beta subunit
MSRKRVNVSRREFLVMSTALGTGFSLGMMVPFAGSTAFAAEDADKAEPGTKAAETPEVNAWVVIEPDDTVIIRIARSEMGQGTLTGLAQLVAEELECDWSKVTTEYPTPGQNLARDRVWGSFATGGSRGIRMSESYVRKGGAAARTMLIEAAAEQWDVPMKECSAENSVITHTPSGRTTTYGKVAAHAAELFPPEQVELKDPKDWKLIGQPVKRLDTADKLNGKQVFGADLQLPGMLNASIMACPVFGGKLKSFEGERALKMPGVRKVVKVGDDAVAVVADTWWQANTALRAMPVIWDEGPNATLNSAEIDAMLEAGLDSSDKVFVGNRNGDAKKAIATAAKTVEASYRVPYQHHATMEPMNATALWTKEKCEVWCPTQNGDAALDATAEAAGLAIEQCDVYKIHLGGGFGRRGMSDFVTRAVAVAKQMPGTPVKLLWSREEDMTHGRYHPITMCKLVGGLDDDGQLTGLHVRISGQSILASVNPGWLAADGSDPVTFQGFQADGDHAISYTMPALLVEHAMRNPPIPPGFWRGVNINQNAIYMECFLDELAHTASRDPLEFRRALMKDHPKSRAVLDAVADKAGWGTPAGEGIHRGLATVKTFGSYVAACAEVSVADGKLKIHRIVAATDPGYAVNPQQIEAQVEGSFVFGLSALLYDECTVKGGAIEQTNFHDYPSMLIDEMPKVEVLVMPSGGFWGGIGEPTIAVAAPAVLNAIFAATGKRIRNIPLKNVDLG